MKNKKIIIILTFLLVLIGDIFLVNNIYQSRNKINKTKRKKQNNLAIIIKDENGVETTSKEIPKGLYELNYEKSYCKNNGKILNYDNILGKVSFSFIGTDSCYLYFDYAPYGYLQILNNNGGKTAIKAKGTLYVNLSPVGENGMYAAKDDLGTTYFFNLPSGWSNNWVKFGKEPQAKCIYNDQQVNVGYFNIGLERVIDIGVIKTQEECTSANGLCYSSDFGYVIGVTESECSDAGTWIDSKPTYKGMETVDIYWNIIRINGDNSIRIIYSNNVESSYGKIGIGSSQYNEYNDKAEYVGYMYEIGKQHGFKDNSTIKLFIDNWYKTTSLSTEDSKYVTDTIFCNDRSASLTENNFATFQDWSSTGVNYYYRGFEKRIPGASSSLWDGTLQPTFSCPTNDDRFTVNTINGLGNSALTYPVGLITIDENAFFASVCNNGASTITPFNFNNFAQMILIGQGAHPTNVTYSFMVRPVISLSSKVKFTGDGTLSNPYVISEN